VSRVGVFGGTFDPPHIGHLAIAHAALEELPLDRLLFVPARRSPLKERAPVASDADRLAMLEAAIGGEPRFGVSRVELERDGPSYTVETLEAMNRENPGAELLFIIGTDMYQEIEAWKNFRRLFDLAHLVIVNRPGFPFREDVAPFQVIKEPQVVTLPEKTAVFYLPFVELPISSTEIRDDRRRGAEVR